MGKHIIRWVTSAQARRHMADNQIRPSWKHFVPQIGKARTGICLDMLTTSNWRAPHKRIGFVLDAEELAAGLPVWEIEGHKVYCLSESMRCLFDTAEIRKRKLEVQRNLDFYTQSPDELFVLGTIAALGSRLKGVVTIETGKTLGSACRVELEHFTAVHNIPVISCTAEEFSAMRCAPGGFKVPPSPAPVVSIRAMEEAETA